MPRQIPRIEIPETDIWSTLFERADRPFPDAQVLYQTPAGRGYTYAELRDVAARFGCGLRGRWEWEKGDVLAIFSMNCVDTPAVTWGCHWAGGVVAPANPAYTVGELVHHLRDSGARGLVTQRSLLGVALEAAERVGLGRERVVVIGEEGQGEEVQGVGHFGKMLGEVRGERERVGKDDLAFLVYSSGTTGLPKGVMLTHSNVVSDLFMVNSSEGTLFNWQNDKILAVLPYYHIYGLQCLVHFPAYSGITTIVMSSFNLEDFCSIIQDHKITYTYVAPPIIVHLAKSPVVSGYDLSSLRMITSGAAPLAKDLIYAVKDRLGTEVKQAYGLSETSPVTHTQRQWDHGLGSVGPALPNQVIKFMSPDGVEVQAGKEGELWISGPNVFKGYHNNPEATASSISPDGFFKTGDIGYEDEEGNTYITDRVKELIKYKGFQVAPAELEGLLVGCDLVDDVAVIGVYDERIASEIPLAFVVPRQGVKKSEAKAKEILDWLTERVSNHKRLRGGVRWIDEIPKSASGKILRRILKDMLAKEGKFWPKL